METHTKTHCKTNDLGWPEQYVHTVQDRMYGDFPAKNTVCTPYIPINVWFWPTLQTSPPQAKRGWLGTSLGQAWFSLDCTSRLWFPNRVRHAQCSLPLCDGLHLTSQAKRGWLGTSLGQAWFSLDSTSRSWFPNRVRHAQCSLLLCDVLHLTSGRKGMAGYQPRASVVFHAEYVTLSALFFFVTAFFSTGSL